MIGLVGCSENPVNNSVIQTDKPNTPQRLIVDVVQYYLCIDTVCPPEIILTRIDTTAFVGFDEKRTFMTRDSIITFGTKKYYKDTFIMWFMGYGTVIINNQTFTIREWGYEYIPLYCNRKYTIHFKI